MDSARMHIVLPKMPFLPLIIKEVPGINDTWAHGQLLHQLWLSKPQMEKGWVLGEGVTSSHLHDTLGVSKPSLDLASCVVSSSYLGLSVPWETSEPNELMCGQGLWDPVACS